MGRPAREGWATLPIAPIYADEMKTAFTLLACAVLMACDPSNVPRGAGAERAPGPSACALPERPIVAKESDLNVDGAALGVCSSAPLTGFFRDGRCSTGAEDTGVHVVCSRVTTAFLEYTKSRGNDLVTPRGSFAGLKDGDRWCLCAARWGEAERAGVAPPVVIEATHASAAKVLDPALLRAHALRDPAR